MPVALLRLELGSVLYVSSPFYRMFWRCGVVCPLSALVTACTREIGITLYIPYNCRPAYQTTAWQLSGLALVS
jgi:hypothetical protein